MKNKCIFDLNVDRVDKIEKENKMDLERDKNLNLMLKSNFIRAVKLYVKIYWENGKKNRGI